MYNGIQIYEYVKNLTGDVRMLMLLEELVEELSTGIVISRIEAKEGEAKIGEASILTLRAINCGVIEEKELDEISIAKRVDFSKISHSGDIILKMNRPYDSVYIDEDYEGYIIPSFCCKIRNVNRTIIDPYYLVGYLNSDLAKEYLRTANGAAPASLLKIRDIRKLPIPLPEITEQRAIGEVFKVCCERKIILNEMIKHEMKMAENIIYDAVRGAFENERK